MANNRNELNKNLAQMLKGGVIMDVTTPEQAKMLAGSADGVIVGSAIVRCLEGATPFADRLKVLSTFASQLAHSTVAE